MALNASSTMSEYPINLEWTIAEERLKALKDSINNEELKSDEFTVVRSSGVQYSLRIYPNGFNEKRGNTMIFLHMKLGNEKKIEAEYTFSIKSAEWNQKINYTFEKSKGWGTSCSTVAKFFDPNKKFIVDGKFIIKVEGTLFIEKADSKWIRKHLQPKRTTTQSLRDLWNTDFKDFTFVADGKEIEVHKNVLACQSPVFAAMLKPHTKEAKESKVAISDFTFEVVEKGIKLCYKQILVSDCSVKENLLLLKFTDKYDIKAVKASMKKENIQILSKISTFLSNILNPKMLSEDEAAMMIQMPSTCNFERRLEPIYLIQAFDHLLQLFHNQQLNYIGVNKTDIYKDIANLPVYLFYSNPDALLDELDGLCYLTKFLDAYKNGKKIVYRMNQNRLLNSIRRLLSFGSDNDIYDIQNVIQKLGFLVFSLTDIVSFDLHDFNWQILLKMFEEIQKNSFIDGKMFYNTLNNDSKDFLIAHLLKPASLPSTLRLPNSEIPGTDFIPILPNELIIQIFSNLSGKDLLSCTGVSKQWRKYSQSRILWENICNFDGVFENSFLSPFYKPRPQRTENSWLIGFGDKYFKEHAIEMPPRFYNRSSIMYFPAMDYFGLQWHNEMSQNECTKLISKWLRAQRIKQNWIRAKPTNIAEIFVHDDGPITCMDIKAGIIASGSDNRSLACFSMIDGRLKFYKKKAHGGGIWSIGINEAGTWIATGATDRTVRVWKTDDGSLLKIFVGHANIVRTLKVVGDRIISGSRDKTVRIWNMESARSIILEHEVDGIRHIETGNGMIFSGGYEGTIKVWDIESGEFIQALEGHTGRITKMQYDSTQNILVTGSLDSSIIIWDLQSFKAISSIKTKSKIINLILDKNKIYSAHSDSTIKFWNWKNAEQFYEILNHSKEISTMFLAPFNSLVTHDEKGNVHLWSTIDGKHLCTLYENNDVVNSRILQFGGSSTQLIIGTNRCDSTLIIALDFDFPNP